MLLENFIVSKVIFAHQAIFSTLYIGRPDVGHNNERWSELIITCSFIDITNFTYILILYGLSRKKKSYGIFKMYPGTHTHPFNGPLSGTTRVGRYQKGKTNLDFIEARDSEWQWHKLGHMQVCTLLQTDNHASTPPLRFLQTGCPSCCPTNSQSTEGKGGGDISWKLVRLDL